MFMFSLKNLARKVLTAGPGLLATGSCGLQFLKKMNEHILQIKLMNMMNTSCKIAQITAPE